MWSVGSKLQRSLGVVRPRESRWNWDFPGSLQVGFGFRPLSVQAAGKGCRNERLG